MPHIMDKMASIILPARVSETLYQSERDIDVDYNALEYEIHICTLNEEGYIEDTLDSLSSQKPVQNGDVDIVLIDSNSTDETVRIAREYVDEVIQSEKGLLTARNKGIKLRDPDVVLSADAGDIYLPGWVDELAKPFDDEKVVASYGNIYSKDPVHKRNQKLKHSIVNTWNLPGNNSAIRVSALRELGMFDESVEQQSLIEMVLEEQIFTKVELATIGKIAYRPYAAMYKSQRRKERTVEKNSNYKRQQEKGERF
jgi:glycosyltransferase involved in cell wall biosynthesis